MVQGPRTSGYSESAGINRPVVGDERALQEGSGESILASSLACDKRNNVAARKTAVGSPIGHTRRLRTASVLGRPYFRQKIDRTRLNGHASQILNLSQAQFCRTDPYLENVHFG